MMTPARITRCPLTAILVWLALAPALGVADAPAVPAFRIAMVGDDGDPRNATVMATIEERLAEACDDPCTRPATVRRFSSSGDAWRDKIGQWDLVVAVGSHASRVVAQTPGPAPRLYTFLPKAAWEALQGCCIDPEHRHAALFIDQPVARQLTLVRHLLPTAARVGVLLGEVSSRYRRDLEEAAARQALRIELATVDDPDTLGARLRQIVRSTDVLLALPDPEIYNGQTIYAVLLTTYGARVPVVGFSEALTRAGAAAAVYATPRDTGDDATAIIEHYRATGTLVSPGYGNRFSISVNPDVVRSLRLPPTTADALRDRLMNESP